MSNRFLATVYLLLFISKQCIIKVSLSVISLGLRLRLITLTTTLIIPDITKNSSNNCLLSSNLYDIYRGETEDDDSDGGHDDDDDYCDGDNIMLLIG